MNIKRVRILEDGASKIEVLWEGSKEYVLIDDPELAKLTLVLWIAGKEKVNQYT